MFIWEQYHVIISPSLKHILSVVSLIEIQGNEWEDNIMQTQTQAQPSRVLSKGLQVKVKKDLLKRENPPA